MKTKIKTALLVVLALGLSSCMMSCSTAAPEPMPEVDELISTITASIRDNAASANLRSQQYRKQ